MALLLNFEAGRGHLLSCACHAVAWCGGHAQPVDSVIEYLCENLLTKQSPLTTLSCLLYSVGRLLKTCGWVSAQMATLEKAEGLLEELRSASYDAAVREMDEVKQYAAENVRAQTRPVSPLEWLVTWHSCTPAGSSLQMQPSSRHTHLSWLCVCVLSLHASCLWCASVCQGPDNPIHATKFCRPQVSALFGGIAGL